MKIAFTRSGSAWEEVQGCFHMLVQEDVGRGISEWMYINLKIRTDTQKQVFALTVWVVWLNRNKAWVGEEQTHPSKVRELISKQMEELNQRNTSTILAPCERGGCISKWSRPPVEWYEVTTDFALTVWVVWLNRNKAWVGEEQTHPSKVRELISKQMEELNQRNTSTILAPCERGGCISKWSRPPVEWYEVTTDFAQDSSKGIFSIGAIVRNCEGETLCGFARVIVGHMNSTDEEVLALKEGLKLASERSVTKIVAESDCLELVNHLKKAKT